MVFALSPTNLSSYLQTPLEFLNFQVQCSKEQTRYLEKERAPISNGAFITTLLNLMTRQICARLGFLQLGCADEILITNS